MRQQLPGETEGRPVALKVVPHASLERSKAKQKVLTFDSLFIIAEN